MENKPLRIIWHHSASAGPGHQAKAIDAYHQQRGFPKSSLGFYGGYHVLVEKDGTIFRYRQDNEIGAHSYGQNVNSLGICLAGNFETEVPTKEQQEAFARQLHQWVERYNISIKQIQPHRHFKATACPGKRLYDAWAQEILNDPLPEDAKDLQVHDCGQ